MPALSRGVAAGGWTGSLHRDSWVEVDLDAIVANAEALSSLVPPDCGLAPVLKANAYGHGAVSVANRLVEVGLNVFCVATIDEGLELRAAGLRSDIIVLYEPPPHAFQEGVEATLQIGIGSREGLQSAVRLPRELRARARFQLAIDTGMTREGLRRPDVLRLLGLLRRLGGSLAGVWTHLADGADPVRVRQQLDEFDSIASVLAAHGLGAPRHAAASAAILSGHGINYELVRPGLALYGAVPSEYSALNRSSPVVLRPAMAVRGRPTRVASVPRGTRVGYGGAFMTKRRARLATVPIGYADGLCRSLGNGRGIALVNNQRAPIVGRVSMDSSVVDVTGVDRVGKSTLFTYLGRSGSNTITLEALSEAAGTIPQVLAVGFGARLPVRHLSRDLEESG